MAIKLALRTLLLALFLTGLAVLAPSPVRAAQTIAQTPHTPPPGSVERKAILAAMRMKIKELHGLDVVFVVRAMNVSGGWAWVHTLPRSTDGLSRYEDFSALLHNESRGWRIAEIASAEPDNPDYFTKLVRRFPSAPSSIFSEDASVR